jgi:dihydroorotase
VFDLPTVLSKFLLLGLSIEEVLRRATVNPAGAFKFPPGTGTLEVGSTADVAVFELREGNFEFTDSIREKRSGQRKLIPVASIKAGRVYGNAWLPVETASRWNNGNNLPWQRWGRL